LLLYIYIFILDAGFLLIGKKMLIAIKLTKGHTTHTNTPLCDSSSPTHTSADTQGDNHSRASHKLCLRDAAGSKFHQLLGLKSISRLDGTQLRRENPKSSHNAHVHMSCSKQISLHTLAGIYVGCRCIQLSQVPSTAHKCAH
jgi:hypothetical protein